MDSPVINIGTKADSESVKTLADYVGKVFSAARENATNDDVIIRALELYGEVFNQRGQ